MTTVAIVGAGFSGTLLALHLLRRCPPSTKLILIERNSQFGRGVAYATPNPSHILNVPAGRMSAFHDRPDDFLNWLTSRTETASCGPQSFAPRQVFGDYIRTLLSDEIRRSGRERLELVKGNVVGLDRTVTPAQLALDRDRSIQADFVVLAPGNFPPAPISVNDPSFYDTSFYRSDPWAADALTDLDPDAPVLLLGTGLTMIDAVISLLDRRHRGTIHAISRRGLLPRRHATGPVLATEHPPFPTSVTALTRFFRQEVKRAATGGGSWQPIIDELRPFTVDVWQTMPLPERQRFLRHLRPWWEVHRHRMAAEVADRIDAARDHGQLRIRVGRIRRYNVESQKVVVAYRPRGQDRLETIEAARVINCAGPTADYDRISDPLIRNLLHEGIVRPDPLRLGLDVTSNCALVNKAGAVSRRLFAVGPVTKGAFWEMTAVPDIRRQTERLAEHLGGLIKAAPANRL